MLEHNLQSLQGTNLQGGGLINKVDGGKRLPAIDPLGMLRIILCSTHTIPSYRLTCHPSLQANLPPQLHARGAGNASLPCTGVHRSILTPHSTPTSQGV